VNIRVLGSHGSDLLLKTPDGPRICRSVGFLVNDELMVDAGTLASALTLEEQQRVKHILLSHLHLDHIKGIPPLVDNIFGLVDHQVVVASLSSVVDGLKKHVFNDMVFPNFFDLQGPRHSILRAQNSNLKKKLLCPADSASLPCLLTIP
jgi:cAMP phosphodiesterase